MKINDFYVLIMFIYFGSLSCCIQCHDIEMCQITAQMLTTVEPLFEQLRLIYVEAFLSKAKAYAFANDSRLIHIAVDTKTAIEEQITNELRKVLYAEVSEYFSAIPIDIGKQPVYLIVARDIEANPIGFALFLQTNVHNRIKDYLFNIIKGSLDESVPDAMIDDEVWCKLLAVLPNMQNNGLGKALLFSIFEYYPHIQKIYLMTSAASENIKAQGFYDHVGMRRLLRIINPKALADREKFIYGYVKK